MEKIYSNHYSSGVENIKQYGDLTDEELFEFLHEIESGDEAIQEAQSEAIEKIDTEEEHVAYAELSENAELKLNTVKMLGANLVLSVYYYLALLLNVKVMKQQEKNKKQSYGA